MTVSEEIQQAIQEGINSLPNNIQQDDVSATLQQRITVKLPAEQAESADEIIEGLEADLTAQLNDSDLSDVATTAATINALNNDTGGNRYTPQSSNPEVNQAKAAAQKDTTQSIVGGLGEGVGEESVQPDTVSNRPPTGQATSTSTPLGTNAPQAGQTQSAITPGQEDLPMYNGDTEAGQTGRQEYAQDQLDKQLDAETGSPSQSSESEGALEDSPSDDAQTSEDDGDFDPNSAAEQLSADRRAAQENRAPTGGTVRGAGGSSIQAQLEEAGLADGEVGEALDGYNSTSRSGGTLGARVQQQAKQQLIEALQKQSSGLKMVGGGFLIAVAVIKDISDLFDATVLGYVVGIICGLILTLSIGIQRGVFLQKVIIPAMEYIVIGIVLELIPFIDSVPITFIETMSFFVYAELKRSKLGGIIKQLEE